MAKRKSITPKTRFEVFKRDSFKCQYCGKSAPEIILEVDHINPVSKGGGNEILNLISSCWDCNRGKAGKKLNDTTVIDKQMEQLAHLQERRNQLDMLLQWKTGLVDNSESEFDKVHSYFKALTKFGFSESGQKKLKTWVKKYGAANVIESMDEAYRLYYDASREDDNVEFVIGKIHPICLRKTLTPEQRAISERVGLVIKKAKNKFYNRFDYHESVIAIKRFMSAYDENIDALEIITDEADNYRDWKGQLYA